jgi:hypothetical protein
MQKAKILINNTNERSKTDRPFSGYFRSLGRTIMIIKTRGHRIQDLDLELMNSCPLNNPASGGLPAKWFY